MSSKAQNDMLNTTKEIIETLRCLGIIIQDFQPANEAHMFQKVNDLVGKMAELDRNRNSYDCDIPEEVLKFIDNGQNPDLYVQDSIQRCLSGNQRVKGKFRAIETLKAQLMEEMKTLEDIPNGNDKC